MKLIVSKRAGKSKSELNMIRHRGDVPGVIYKQGQPGEKIVLNGVELEKFFRGLKQGHLPTTTFDIEFEGKTVKALMKEIQYAPTTYKVMHVDFLILDNDTMVDVKVPLECVGDADSPGVKLGGFVRQVIRHMKVRCLPKAMPKQFVLNVGELDLNQTKRVKDVPMPHGVKALMAPNDVVVLIAKR